MSFNNKEDDRNQTPEWKVYERLAIKLMLVGLILGPILILANLGWAAVLVMIICGVSAVDFYRRSQRLKENEYLLHLAREELSRQLGHAIESYTSQNVHSGSSDELSAAGVMLWSPSGKLGDKMIYQFAKKDQTTYEYDGLAQNSDIPIGYLIINGLIYKPLAMGED